MLHLVEHEVEESRNFSLKYHMWSWDWDWTLFGHCFTGDGNAGSVRGHGKHGWLIGVEHDKVVLVVVEVVLDPDEY